MWVATIVGVVVHVAVVAVVPTMAVNVIVIGIVVVGGAGVAGEVVVGRHRPSEGRTMVSVAETEILGSAVHVAISQKIDALEVDRHVDFIARIGVPSVNPDFEERRADLLSPDFIDQAIGGQLVFIAAVDHQLVFVVEDGNSAGGLSVGEIKDVVGCSCEGCYNQSQC